MLLREQRRLRARRRGNLGEILEDYVRSISTNRESYIIFLNCVCVVKRRIFSKIIKGRLTPWSKYLVNIRSMTIVKKIRKINFRKIYVRKEDIRPKGLVLHTHFLQAIFSRSD